MMNTFRFIGDMCHVVSILVLLLRLRVTKNANGISIKTQELYLLVFCTRYLDLFTKFYSLYNTVMKILYILSTSYIVYLVKKTEPFKSNYEYSQDSFLHWKFAVAPCVVLAILTSIWQGYWGLEIPWIFSIYLEAIAILPQLITLHRYREVENLTSHYVALLGAYRGLYIFNWIYRSYTEEYYHQTWVVYICGVCQTLLYLDFFYYYFQAKFGGKKIVLPS